MQKKSFPSDKKNAVSGSSKRAQGDDRKPFKNTSDRPGQKTRDKEDGASFRKSSGVKPGSASSWRDKDNGEGKPFRKSYGKDGAASPGKNKYESNDRPSRKSFGEKPGAAFRKDNRSSADEPFRKPYGKEERPSYGKKRQEGGERPFQKSFGEKAGNTFRKDHGGGDEKPYRKSYGKGDNSSDKKYGPGKDQAPRKSYGERSGSSFRNNKDHGNEEGKPYKRPYVKSGERSFEQFRADGKNRSSRKPSEERDTASPGNDKDYKRQGSRSESSFGDKRKGVAEGVQKPDRYQNTFGKRDDEELIAHKKKQVEKAALKEQSEEVTFTKEVDKWDEKPVEKAFGKSEIKRPAKKSLNEEGVKHRHDDQTRFKKHFDDEHPYEKAYSATSAGNKPAEPLQIEGILDEKEMPLNKYIAHCDVCSRREAALLIKQGRVKVNGELVIEPGHKVTIEDEVTLNDAKLVIQKNLIYILMNKPKGFITTTDDPKGRRTVMEMVENVIEERIFPVGRLDRNTTGLLLLTNDGELTQKLSHPKYEIKKVYKVSLDKNLSKEDFEKVKAGVILEDGKAEVNQVEYLDTKAEIGLEIHSGRNRIVRRIFESLGYVVEKLDRVVYAGLTKKNIMRGNWRFLTKQEVINLKHLK